MNSRRIKSLERLLLPFLTVVDVVFELVLLVDTENDTLHRIYLLTSAKRPSTLTITTDLCFW